MDPPEKTETEIGASSEEQTVKSEEQPRECKKPLGDRMKEYEAPFGTIKVTLGFLSFLLTKTS